MFKKEFIVGVLVAFFFLGFFGTAFAGEGDYKSLLGTDEFTFDTPATSADVAARSNIYNQEHLALVSTEAGDWEYNAAPATKAQVAAKNYNYNQAHLALVGTEAGDSAFNFEGSKTISSDTRATAGNKVNPECPDC